MDANAVLLSHWVLDEGKFVTCSYLLRNSDLNVEQAQRLLEDFLKENSANESVNASYFLVGTLKNEGGGIERKKSIVCRSNDLEEGKNLFECIDNCSIYSVQAKPLSSFHVLFNASWLDAQIYLSPTKEKSLVRNQVSIDNYKRWKESHKDEENRLEQSSIRSIFADKIKDEVKSRTEQNTAKKIDNLFAKSVKKSDATPEKKKKLSPKRSLSPNSPNKESNVSKNLTQPEKDEKIQKSNGKAEGKKRKSQNSLFSSDEHEAAKKQSVSSTLNNDDIFCTGEQSSPEKWEIENKVESSEAPSRNSRGKGSSSKSKKEKPLVKLIGGDSDEESDGQNEEDKKGIVKNGKKKSKQAEADTLPKSYFQAGLSSDKHREKVTRKYVDDDGFEVTEVVMTDVDNDANKDAEGANLSRSCDIKPEKSLSKKTTPIANTVLKPSNVAPKTANAKKNSTASSAQTKISSFFKKN